MRVYVFMFACVCVYLFLWMCVCMSVPVLAVWLQVRNKVRSSRLHGDCLLIEGDDVRGHLFSIVAWLLPFEEKAGGGGVAQL